MRTCLFDRCGQTLVLNDAGRQYMAEVGPAVAAIQCATAKLVEGGEDRLCVATSHSFATSWLSSRIESVNNLLGIEIDILPTRDCGILRSGQAQIGIWGGLGPRADFVSEVLIEGAALPVASPAISGRWCDHDTRPFGDQTLLEVKSPTGLWNKWLVAAGKPVGESKVRTYSTLQGMYESAAAGAGIALAMPLVAEPFLASGALVPCSQRPHNIGEQYRIYRSPRLGRRARSEHAFLGWLRKEVQLSLTRFGQLKYENWPSTSG